MIDPEIEIRRLARLVPPGDILYVPSWDLDRYNRAHGRPADALDDLIIEGIHVRRMEILDPE